MSTQTQSDGELSYALQALQARGRTKISSHQGKKITADDTIHVSGVEFPEEFNTIVLLAELKAGAE